MEIKTALSIKVGDIVRYPEDRGEPAGQGEVVYTSPIVHKNIYGKEYIWVTVKKEDHNTVWPSNRLL